MGRAAMGARERAATASIVRVCRVRDGSGTITTKIFILPIAQFCRWVADTDTRYALIG